VIRIAITEAARLTPPLTPCRSAAPCMRPAPPPRAGGLSGSSAAVDQLYALRRRGEGLSDVILRLAAMEGVTPGQATMAALVDRI